MINLVNALWVASRRFQMEKSETTAFGNTMRRTQCNCGGKFRYSARFVGCGAKGKDKWQREEEAGC